MNIDLIQNNPESLKRYKSALRKDLTVYWIDRNKKEAVFSDKNVHYRTTLNSCECDDFKKGSAPCEHMYRLEIELDKNQVTNNNDAVFKENIKKSTEAKPIENEIKKSLKLQKEVDIKTKKQISKCDIFGFVLIWALRAGIIYYWFDSIATGSIDEFLWSQTLVLLFFTYWVFVGYKDEGKKSGKKNRRR